MTSAKTEFTSPVTSVKTEFTSPVTSVKTELTSPVPIPVSLQAFASDACSGQGPAVGEGGNCSSLTTAPPRRADPLPNGECPTRPETTESASLFSQRLLKRGRKPPQRKKRRRKKKRMRSMTRSMKNEEEEV
jgi:hypothetical protein